MSRDRLVPALMGLAMLAAVGALWFFFAPTQLGGRVEYATVAGSSMQPALHSGDLAVLRESHTYAVGQIVGYRNADLHRVVLHRIVGRRGDRFEFKGDANGFVDSVQPISAQLVGRLWLRIPAVGAAALWLRTPGGIAAIGALIALFLFGGAGIGAIRGPGGIAIRPWAASALVVAGATAAVALSAVVVIGSGEARTRTVTDGSAYVQRAAFGYSAVAGRGAVYPSGRVRTGDAVFTHLVHRLTMRFDYRFSSALPHVVSGSGTVTARLESQQGLRRTFELASAAFADGRWTATGVLDLDQLEQTIAAYERSTGVEADSYTVTIVPRVSVHGSVAGRPLRARFEPTPLSLGLDREKLKVLLPEQVGSGSPPDPFHASAIGALARTEPVAAPLRSVRAPAFVGALVAAVIALTGLALLRRPDDDEVARIERRYRSWLIPVASPLTATTIVDVTTMESLVRLAEHYERAILHEEEDGEHTFALEEGGTLYRFRLGREGRHLVVVGAHRPLLPLARWH